MALAELLGKQLKVFTKENAAVLLFPRPEVGVVITDVVLPIATSALLPSSQGPGL